MRNHYPGPLDSPPLALVLRLTRGSRPDAHGQDVAWLPIGRLAPGEHRHAIDDWAWALDAPAADYVLHLLLVEDTREARVLDSRELHPALRWRGGIDLQGPLRIAFDGYGGVLAEFHGIRNRRFDGHSGDLYLQLYRTRRPGPAAAGEFVCEQRLAGLYAGEGFDHPRLDCALPPGDPDPWTYHLFINDGRHADGDTLTETVPDHGVAAAGSLPPGVLIVALLLAALRRACAHAITDSRMRALQRARSSVG